MLSLFIAHGRDRLIHCEPPPDFSISFENRRNHAVRAGEFSIRLVIDMSARVVRYRRYDCESCNAQEQISGVAAGVQLPSNYRLLLHIALACYWTQRLCAF